LVINGVNVIVAVGVLVGVLVGVFVGAPGVVGVGVGVLVIVDVGVFVGEFVGVLVGPPGVLVGVFVGVFVAVKQETIASPRKLSNKTYPVSDVILALVSVVII
jgi:hypothetical protein